MSFWIFIVYLVDGIVLSGWFFGWPDLFNAELQEYPLLTTCGIMVMNMVAFGIPDAVRTIVRREVWYALWGRNERGHEESGGGSKEEA